MNEDIINNGRDEPKSILMERDVYFKTIALKTTKTGILRTAGLKQPI